MNYQNTATPKLNFYANLSLLSISIAVVFGAVHHVFELKTNHALFFIPLLIIPLWLLLTWFRRSESTAALWFYGLLSGLIILVPGVMDGFWNHAFKLFIYKLHNDFIPPLLAKLFHDTTIHDHLFEGTGIMTFIASLFAAYFGYMLLRERRKLHHGGTETRRI